MRRTRRSFLRRSVAGWTGLAGAGLLGAGTSGCETRGRPRASTKGKAVRATGEFVVESIDRTTLRLPYRDAPRRAMDRELPHWRYTEVFEVKLRSGAVGIGETLLYYTWGRTDEEDVSRALGKNAVDLLWDDSLGAGLQIGLFDAVARTAGVPIHRLLGPQVHETTPLSWWNIDMEANDMASECALAHKQGYMAYKTKGRPWFDIWKQMDLATKGVPAEFKIDMDFNDTLRDADRGIPILKRLDEYPQIDIYETPIPQGDVEGNVRIRAETRAQIALHYGNPSPRVCVEKGACDGFVIGGGASRVMKQGSFAGEVGMPFWLQLVGTDITAAYSLHFGGVLTQARWPAVNCHQLYTHSLLTKPIVVKNGHAAVPDGPGLGFDLNREMVEKFRVEKPKTRPEPRRLIETTFPDGRVMYLANDGSVNFMLRRGNNGEIPYYVDGADTRGVPDDGSARWSELWEKSQKAPYFEKRQLGVRADGNSR